MNFNQNMGLNMNQQPMNQQPMNQQPINLDMLNQMMMSQPITTGPKGGTKISALQNMPHQNAQPAQMQNQQYRTRENNDLHRQSYDTNTDVNNNDTDQPQHHIKHLVRDINRSLDDYSPSKTANNTEEYENDIDSDGAEHEEQNESKNNEYISSEMIKEALLLFIIYIILSQSFVKKTIGKYVPYITNGNDSTKIFGVLIYGALLTILFIACKKVFLH